LQQETGKPVLLVIKTHLVPEGGDSLVGYQWRFLYTPADFIELNRQSSRLALPRDATDENFDVYLMKQN